MRAFRILSFCFLLVGVLRLPAQEAERIQLKDKLSAEFHQSRRDSLRQLLPPKTLAVFFANPVRNRANDVDYLYHQDPDFYYLTGYKEPHSVLLLSSPDTHLDEAGTTQEILFVQPRDPYQEMWNGFRLGKEGAKQSLQLKEVLENTDFGDFNLRLEAYEHIMVLNLRTDVLDTRNKADLFDLNRIFGEKVNQTLTPLNAVENKMKVQLDFAQLETYMNKLREVKEEEELALLRKAIKISCIGQIEVMKAMHPHISEREIQGIHEFMYRKYDAEYQGYPSIVGSGHNGCVLHYWQNAKPEVGRNLVLMDLGAEYRGYTADVTRTIPASGTFSEEQRIIYDIVYEAQSAGFEECLVGNSFRAPDAAARKIINQRLFELGIISSPVAQHRYFPHGTSHYLGLDVHDRGEGGPLKANSVITVEPGIYIPEGSPCDEKWWGIAIRIEDDILITEEGWENLSSSAPRKAEEIEAMMKQPSIFSQLEKEDLD